MKMTCNKLYNKVLQRFYMVLVGRNKDKNKHPICCPLIENYGCCFRGLKEIKHKMCDEVEISFKPSEMCELFEFTQKEKEKFIFYLLKARKYET